MNTNNGGLQQSENFPGTVQMSELQVEHLDDYDAEEAVLPSLRRAVDKGE